MLIVIENSRTSFRSASSTACARTIYKMVPTTDIHYAEFELDIRSMENVKQAEALGVLPSSPVHGSRKQLSKNKTLCWTEEVHMQEKRRTGRRDPRTGKSRLPVKRRVDRNKVAPQKLARRSKKKQHLARGILCLRHARRLVLANDHTQERPRWKRRSCGSNRAAQTDPRNTWRAQTISSIPGAPC
jgi:hypothetical protein